MANQLQQWAANRESVAAKGESAERAQRIGKTASIASKRAEASGHPKQHFGAQVWHERAAAAYRKQAAEAHPSEKRTFEKRAAMHDRAAEEHKSAIESQGADEYNRDDQGRFASK